ncbi:MAG: FAD-dependent monooxygenase, partial [Cyanobacteriota bacterium]
MGWSRRDTWCRGLFVGDPSGSSPLTSVPNPPRAVVRGAGPAGSLAALALADAGWSVRLIDPHSPERLQASRRAYAFTHSSCRLLRRLGLWEPVSPLLHPFRRLDLTDLGAGCGLAFQPTDLWGGRSAQPPVGWIGDHSALMAVLLERVAAHPAIEARLGDLLPTPAARSGARAVLEEPDLTVAADGSLSPTRDALGIGIWRHPYGQHCLTAQVTLRGAPPEMAWERLRPEGPFALLPLARGRFQVVWSAPGWRCRQLESLSSAAFLDALASILPPGLDVSSIEEPQRVFPVGLQLARRLHRGRTILLGETAHRCHPVGGQGLNLSWRDVAVLHRLAQRVRAGQLPLDRLGGSYGRRRWPDLCLT